VLLAALLAAFTLLTFSPVLNCDFVNYDDTFYVTTNPYVQMGLTWQGLSWGLTTLYYGNWHPLVWWSLMVDSQVYGSAAAGFHLTNLLWHAGSVLLLFAALRRMTGRTWPSAFAAALFAVHPLNVEPVAWIAERKGVVSTFGWMLTLLAYCYYAERPGFFRYLLVVGSLVLGLMAKPVLVTLPCVLLLLDFWPLRRFWRPIGTAAGSAPPRFPPTSVARLVAEKVPLFALIGVFCVVAMKAQGLAGALPSLSDRPLAGRLENVAFSYLWYLYQGIYPSKLAPFLPYVPVSFAALRAAGAALFLAAVSLLVLWQARRAPYLAVGWLWYLVTLFPVSGIVPIGSHAQADRYAYIPLVGIFCLVAWGATDLAMRQGARPTVTALAGIALAYCAITSWTQAHFWHDSRTLWEHTLKVTGGTPMAHWGLGYALEKQGNVRGAMEHYEAALRLDPRFEPANHRLGLVLMAAGRVQEAIAHFRAAIQVRPRQMDGHNNLGLALMRQGELEEAVREFKLAQESSPGEVIVRTNLGLALLRQGKADEAVATLREAVRLQPEFAPAQYQLGRALTTQGDWEHAAACFRAALRRQPADAESHRGLAFALHGQGLVEEAKAEYQECSRIAPGWTEQALRSSWELSSDPRPGRRSARLALLEAEQVRQAVQQDQPRVLDALAAAYAEGGRFSEAAATAGKAKALAAGAGDRRLALQIEERLQLYEKRQAYRARHP
jgi:tetratricopeptide (TPR) repeat protein